MKERRFEGVGIEAETGHNFARTGAYDGLIESSAWARGLDEEVKEALGDISNRTGAMIGEWLDDEQDLQERILPLAKEYVTLSGKESDARKREIEKTVKQILG